VKGRVFALVVVLGGVVLAPGSTSGAVTLSVATLPPSCYLGQVSATGYWEGATNSMAGTVWFTNTSTKPCSLRGYLPVTLRTQSGKALPLVIRRAGITLLPQPVLHPSAVTLAPCGQDAAVFAFQWWNWCRPNPGPLSVSVTISSQRSLVVTPMGWGFSATPSGCLSRQTRSWIGLTPVRNTNLNAHG
jgi:hypothetical protein